MKKDKRKLLLINAAVACLLVMNGLIIFNYISNASIKSYQEATEPTEMDDDSDYEEDASEDEDVNQIIEDTGETEMDEVSETTEDTQETILEETEEVSVPEEITAYYNFLSDILAQAYEVTDIYAAVTDGYDSDYYCKYGIADFDSDGVIDLILYSECWDE
jgi:hypothetical protein